MCEPLLLTVEQAACRLNLGRSFVYQHLIQPGLLPSIKVQGARRVLVSDLEEFVQKLKREQADQPYACLEKQEARR